MKIDIKEIIEKIGKWSILIWAFSFFFISGGLLYSVWLGLLMLIIKGIINKKIETGNKWIFYSVIYVYIGVVLIDIVTFKTTGKIVSYDDYSLLLMYPVFINFIKTKDEVFIIIKLFILSFFISFFGIIPYLKEFLVNPSNRIRSFTQIGQFGHMLSTGSTFVLGSLLFIKKSKKKDVFLFIVYFLAILLMALNKTRGAILSAGIAQMLLIFYYVFYTKKIKVLYYVIIFVVAAFLIIPNNQKDILKERFNPSGSSSMSNNLRIMFWKASLYSLKTNPLYGVGTEGTRITFKEYFTKTGEWEMVKSVYQIPPGDSHNAYMAMLARYGLLVGGYLIVFFLIIVPILYIKNYRKISKEYFEIYQVILFAYLCFIMGALTDSITTNKVGNLFIFLISLLGISIKTSKENKDKNV